MSQVKARNQEFLRILPSRVAEAQALGSSSSAFPDHCQGTRLGEQLGFELTPIWDTGVKGRGVTHYATTTGP